MARMRLGLTLIAVASVLGGQAAKTPSFDVASVRSSPIAKAGGEGSRRENIQSEPGSLTMRNVSLSSCIQWAYDVRPYQVTGPEWMRDERYDISAKSDSPVKQDQLRLMLQGLLAERFQVSLHRQTRDLPAYVLLVGKNGSKLHPSASEGDPVLKGGKLNLMAERMPLSQFTDLLAGPLQAPVIDMTGLTGRFDFTLDLTSYLAPYLQQEHKPGDPPPDLAAIVITALQEELGLKLEQRKMPIEMLVVDRAEKAPTEN
jgi:uncharacterized protein (TIGR03435 family)